MNSGNQVPSNEPSLIADNDQEEFENFNTNNTQYNNNNDILKFSNATNLYLLFKSNIYSLSDLSSTTADGIPTGISAKHE